jgi:hypothetical protein
MFDNNGPGCFLLAGLLIAFAGFRIWKTGWDPVRENPIPHFAGILAMIYGVVLVFHAINKIRKSKRDTGEFMICTECGEVIGTWKVQDRKCPKCGGGLDPLEGFYQRHPERRDDMDHAVRKRDG